MKLYFSKMHGLGNDFMVIDGVSQPIQLTKHQISNMAQRHTGIGFDQLLVVEKSTSPEFDFFYRIFNADGQEVGQCGNGARCLALFVKKYGLTDKQVIHVSTKTSQLILTIHNNNEVSVNMGKPKLAPADIPLLFNEQAMQYTISLADTTVNFHAIQVGNPHAVLIIDDINNAPLDTIGQYMSKHSVFPEQSNIGFMQILSANHLALRVYERGCGETQACGSGAVAAAAIGRLYYNLDKLITVSLPGGDLLIEWVSPEEDLILTGPASFIYEGRIEL